MKLRQTCLSFINRIIPKSDRIISIYGRKAINDNGLALTEYIKNNRSKKYKIFLILTDNVNVPQRYLSDNVRIITNPLRSIYILFRSKWIFHTYGMHACAMIPAKGQIIFSLWHGSPLKRICKLDKSCTWNFDPRVDSYYLSASSFWDEINKRCWGYEDKQLFVGSNPRNDYLFSDKKIWLPEIKDGKLILFLPTFRNSSKLNRKETTADLPVINKHNILKLDEFLKSNNQYLVIKLHPAQNDIEFLNKNYSNIFVYKNEDLDRIEVNLYELMAMSNALISDFSSVYFDYLLLDRPIGFTIDDLKTYSDKRGFTVEEPLSIMPGPKISNYKELTQFFLDLNNGVDSYADERQTVRKLTNEFCNNDACSRIADFVNII